MAPSALRAGATSIEHGVYLDDEAAALMASTGAVLVTTRIVVVRMLRYQAQIEEAVIANAEEIAEVNVESLRRAARAGTPFNPHGDVAEEAVLLVRDIGLSTEAALRAVTATAARCLLRPELGHLSVGAPGHVVVTGGDPRDDIAALTDVRSVLFAGRSVHPTPVPRSIHEQRQH